MAKKVIIANSNSNNENNETLVLISNYIYNKLKENNINAILLPNDNKAIEKITNDINNKYGKSTENIILFNELINTNQGTEIIYALRNTNQLANKINNEFEKNNLQMNKFYQQRLPGDTSKDYYYITRETNPSETIIINYDLDEYQDFINYANSVALALIDYLNTKKENTYTVVKGDSLYNIAKKFNTTVNNLKNINNLSTNLLSIGQILRIPSSINNTYTVVKGDSLYSIAKKFNTNINDLKNINNLSTNLLSIGQILKIPSSINNTYTVVKGDSLYSIAKKFNTTVNNLKNINNLSTNLLSIGQILKIK